VEVEKHVGVGTGVYFPDYVYHTLPSEHLRGVDFGVELLFRRRFGVLGEAGMDESYELSPTASLNGTCHFGHSRTEKFDPFVQAGFANLAGFHGDGGFGFNARVGATYWASQRIGLRIEFVENIHAYLVEHSRVVVFGITFR